MHISLWQLGRTKLPERNHLPALGGPGIRQSEYKAKLHGQDLPGPTKEREFMDAYSQATILYNSLLQIDLLTRWMRYQR